MVMRQPGCADLIRKTHHPLVGHVRPGLFQLQDNDFDSGRVCETTTMLLAMLDTPERSKISHPIHAKEWRTWSNPEFLLRPFGLRLDEMSEDVTNAILRVMEASLSTEGYQKALSAMHVNHFLGEVCNLPKVMNKYSYNFLLFGEPSTDRPWGWNLYGHHLCLNVFIKGKQIVISPTFTGAEPNIVDAGPYVGTQVLHREGDLGLRLMHSLPPEAKDRAQIFKMMRDPGMLQSGNLKVDRWNQDDQRHLCGAFRDNRVVPYEGVNVSEMDEGQRKWVLEIVEQFTLYLPKRAREMRKEQVCRHFKETFFCWIGGYGDTDPFYFRIQSPVIICEFDHHSGVFLTNKEPAKFHTHTIVRTPNGGDYGNALRATEERVH